MKRPFLLKVFWIIKETVVNRLPTTKESYYSIKSPKEDTIFVFDPSPKAPVYIPKPQYNSPSNYNPPSYYNPPRNYPLPPVQTKYEIPQKIQSNFPPQHVSPYTVSSVNNIFYVPRNNRRKSEFIYFFSSI